MDSFQSKQIADPCRSLYGLLLLPLDFVPIPLQNHHGIFRRQFHHSCLFPFLRHLDGDFSALAGGEPALHQFPVLYLHRQMDLRRDIGGSGIKLFHKAIHHLLRGIFLINIHMEIISADHFPVADKEALDDRIVSLQVTTQYVFFLAPISGDLLFLSHLLHILIKLLDGSGLLKPPFGSGSFHPLFQILQHHIIPSTQKVHGRIDRLAIFLLAHASLTRCIAQSDLMIQTWPVLANVGRKVSIAGPYAIQFMQQLQGLFHCSRTGIGSKISGLVPLLGSGEHHPGIILLQCHPDKGVGLIVHQHGIILGAIFLDQIAFQNERLQLRIGDGVGKSCNMTHHLHDLWGFPPAVLKILTHPVLQADRFSNVDDLLPVIDHHINTGLSRKFFQFFFDIKHTGPP